MGGASDAERYPPAEPQTNRMAIAAMVFAFLGAVLGVVFASVALWQIDQTGERGRGLAIAATVVSWAGIILIPVFLILQIGAF